MKLPRVRGIIRRRLLVNYRVDPAVMLALLPDPFRPKLHRGHAIAGICLIRLEQIRPSLLPLPVGLSSENAAHRIAVEWGQGSALEQGVFVPQRHSNSWMNQLLGGRLFPGRHRAARFEVSDQGSHVELRMHSRDGSVRLSISGNAAPALPSTSVFSSLDEASAFFESGSLGYSSTGDEGRYDGMVLDTSHWQVSPLAIEQVHSSYFENEKVFPAGSVQFDHALVMRDIAHQWLAAPDLNADAAGARRLGIRPQPRYN